MRAQIRDQKEATLDKKKVLTKAIKRVATQLDLTRKELSLIIGPSEATFSRLFAAKTKSAYLNPNSNEGKLALLLIRLYKNLDVLFGGNAHQCRIWLRNQNKHLNNKPINMIKSSIEGLVIVVQYLDAMRGKI